MKRMLVLAGALTVITTGEAAAGGFRVANCQSDGLNYSTQAFTDFASRGMAITRACDPEGDGLRGLVTASSVQLRSVPRGAVAFVNLSAPPGTRFENFTWAGIMSRSDCTYALQLYALVPGVKPISIKNVRANSNCPRTARAQGAAYHSRTFNVNGATRIVQRIICLGSRGRNYCSARGANYILSYKAEVSVVDIAPPTISIIGDTPLARGEWVGGSQPLNYDATDNVGVRNAQVVAAGISGGSDPRACTMASGLAYASLVPCPNGPGHIEVKTVLFPEGTQALVAQAEDTATNVGSAEVTARIDNTPPGRVDVAVQGGDAWRSTNDFVVAWANPPETDRAPIVSAITKLCPVGSGACTSGEPTGADIASFAQPVPAPGEWTLVLWRRDAAGNQTETAASVPVTLRYDPDPPQLGFEASPATDPTLVSVQATDNVSGLADGTIEISREGSNTWQELATQMDGSRLTARIDDAALPEGRYQLRSIDNDRPHNEASTTQRLDGQPMVVTLPLRMRSAMKAGILRSRTVRRTIRRHGKRRHVRRRVTDMLPALRVPFGRPVNIDGQLAGPDGQGVVGAEVQIVSSSIVSAEEVVAVLQTDGTGRYHYATTASSDRTFRFVYGGSPLVLPVQTTVDLRVPAVSSLSVDHRRVVNGRAVTFSGRTPTSPLPAGGKLIELQVRLSGRWQTFRTTLTDPAGRWAIQYRFKRTRGVQRFRFRARLPREASYPFGAGKSPVITVRVRGRR